MQIAGSDNKLRISQNKRRNSPSSLYGLRSSFTQTHTHTQRYLHIHAQQMCPAVWSTHWGARGRTNRRRDKQVVAGIAYTPHCPHRPARWVSAKCRDSKVGVSFIARGISECCQPHWRIAVYPVICIWQGIYHVH